MKLLFDQNISFRIVNKIEHFFPAATQVRILGLENAYDIEIWNYTKQYNYSVVSFDADFFDIANFKGHPPKIIWLRLGNTTTANLEKVLTSKYKIIIDFLEDPAYEDISCLEIR